GQASSKYSRRGGLDRATYSCVLVLRNSASSQRVSRTGLGGWQPLSFAERFFNRNAHIVFNDLSQQRFLDISARVHRDHRPSVRRGIERDDSLFAEIPRTRTF